MMMHYETSVLNRVHAIAFANKAEDLIGTEIGVDHHGDNEFTVTVFELETDEEVNILRNLENSL